MSTSLAPAGRLEHLRGGIRHGPRTSRARSPGPPSGSEARECPTRRRWMSRSRSDCQGAPGILRSPACASSSHSPGAASHSASALPTFSRPHSPPARKRSAASSCFRHSPCCPSRSDRSIPSPRRQPWHSARPLSAMIHRPSHYSPARREPRWWPAQGFASCR